MKAVPFEPLSPDVYRELVRLALAEDIGYGDVTTDAVINQSQRARGVLLAKSPCVIAGLDIASEVFRQLDPAVTVAVRHPDGSRCEPGTVVAEYQGSAAALLTAERTALNFLQRLSGTATLTRQFVEAAGEQITVLDTRKTTPLLRTLEKYAVRAGGGVNHRRGLDTAVLIKDNHVRLGGGVQQVVERMRRARPDMPIEVEAQSLTEVDEALRIGADIVLLDNLSAPDIVEAVTRCRGRAKTEISGGVTLSRLPELAATGANYVSVGALTHSAAAVDLSLEIEPL
ncbi:MAG: carboxylating nicotinate-nucleotide diphosphorylase [Acidobacteria bacterium]|nr:carboxylating nicotinate-nucleotide diphosphorylase [Acidobacteriota bacterium]